MCKTKKQSGDFIEGSEMGAEWDKIIERFEEQIVRQDENSLQEAGYAGQGHSFGAETFQGGPYGIGGEKQLAARPIKAVRKIKKQEDSEWAQNAKDRQQRNFRFAGPQGEDAKITSGDGFDYDIKNHTVQIGKSPKELDEFYGDDNELNNYWSDVPEEVDEDEHKTYDLDVSDFEDNRHRELGEQAVDGAQRSGGAGGKYMDLPGFPKMNSLEKAGNFIPRVNGDVDGDGEEDVYLEDEDYINDTLSANGLGVKPGRLSRLFGGEELSERTLYHGTIIDHKNSIEKIGLSGELGDWVKDTYGMSVDENEFEDVLGDVTFAAQKSDLSAAVGAMRYHVGKKINKNLTDVTIEDLAEHGLLIKIEDIEDGAETVRGSDEWIRRPKNMEDEGNYDEYPMSVEPGDWYIEGSSTIDGTYSGKKMIDFLRRNGGLEDIDEDKRRNIIKLAVAYHADESTDEIINKINSIPEQELSSELRKYEKLARHLVDKRREDKKPEQRHKGDQLKFDFGEGINLSLNDVFFEGLSGGSLPYKQGKVVMIPHGDDHLINPVDYSGGHGEMSAADESPGGQTFGQINQPKDFVPEDWEQRDVKTKEAPIDPRELKGELVPVDESNNFWLKESIKIMVKNIVDEAFTGIHDEVGNGEPIGASEKFEKNHKEITDLNNKELKKEKEEKK